MENPAERSLTVTATAPTPHFSCKCGNKICSTDDFVCYTAAQIPSIQVGGIFKQCFLNSLMFLRDEATGQGLAYCSKCGTTLGFQYVIVEGCYSYIKTFMFHFNMDLLTCYEGSQVLTNFSSPDSIFCKGCGAFLAFTSSIRTIEMVAHQCNNRVVLTTIGNCAVLEDEQSSSRRIGVYNQSVCCNQCNSILGKTRVNYYDGLVDPTKEESYLELDKLWLRYRNLMRPAIVLLSLWNT